MFIARAFAQRNDFSQQIQVIIAYIKWIYM